MKQGGPYPPLVHQLLKPGEMTVFGLGHTADLAGPSGPAEHVELTLIDARRPVFAGVVDAHHARDLIGRRGVSGQTMEALFAHAMPRRILAGWRSCRKTARQLPAITIEA